MERVVGDFETYWSADYTLKKQSTSEYICDSRYETISCTILRESENFVPRFLRGELAVKIYLASLPWDNIDFVAHHAHFDAAILNWKYGHKPARITCTLAMARFWHLGETKGYSLENLAEWHNLQGKIGEPPKDKHAADLTEEEWQALEIYNNHDAKLTLYFWSYYAQRMPEHELQLQDMTIRMFTEPMAELNRALLVEAQTEAIQRKVGLDLKTLRSAPKFAAKLIELGVDPPTKLNKKGETAYAFAKKDVGMLELLEHADERVVDLVESRLEATSNIELTRSTRLIRMCDDLQGLAAIYLKPSAARTHRWGGGNKTNFQNPGRKSKLLAALIPPKGYVMISADQAQIEARMLAWLADAMQLLADFEAMIDTYAKFASAVFGRTITKADVAERFLGKTCVLGLGYQTGAAKLRNTLATGDPVSVKISLDEAARIVLLYRTVNAEIPSLWYFLDEMVQYLGNSSLPDLEWKCVRFEPKTHRIWLPNDTSLHYPNLDGQEKTYTDRREVCTIYGGKATENLDQALSRVVISEQALRISERYRIVCTKHDELSVLVPVAEVDEGEAWIIEQMTVRPKWAPTLPLAVEAKRIYRP